MSSSHPQGTGRLLSVVLCLLVACTSAGETRPDRAEPAATTVIAPPADINTIAEDPGTVFLIAKPEAGIQVEGIRSPVVPVYDAPDGPMRTLLYVSEVEGRIYRFPLRNPTVHDQPLVLRIVSGEPGDEWIEVQAPVRTRRRSIWVRSDDFDFHTTTKRIDVDLARDLFIFLDGDDEIVTAATTTGRDGRPTTQLDSYVEQIFASKNNFLGPYVVTWAGFSDTFGHYSGGLPSRGLHGTSQPERLGRKDNNGDVWIDNETLEWIVDFHDDVLGAPVVVYDSSNSDPETSIKLLQAQPWEPALTTGFGDTETMLPHPSSYGGIRDPGAEEPRF